MVMGESGRMIREILFKAKRKDNGEWVVGNLITNERNENQKYIGYIFDERNGVIEDFDLVEVIPDTICQFTGLTDKNGQKIWENDIISISAYSYDEPEDDYFGVVAYCEKDACWCLENSENSDEIICECFGSYTTEIFNHGNIFDNPDLLEVE